MLGHRLRRWPSIKPTSGQRLSSQLLQHLHGCLIQFTQTRSWRGALQVVAAQTRCGIDIEPASNNSGPSFSQRLMKAVSRGLIIYKHYLYSGDITSGPVFSYKLRYIVGFWLVEMAISTNQKPTIYRNLYENTAPAL